MVPVSRANFSSRPLYLSNSSGKIIPVGPKERIPIINRCASTLSGRGWGDIDFLLRQFDLPTTERWGGSGDNTEYDYVRDMLTGNYAMDDDILALDDYLHGAPTHDPDEEPWGDSSLRLFITHLWKHRVDAEALKEELEGWGVEAFVAHRDINPGKEWVRIITAALQTCDVLVPLLHDGFKKSDWCDQEVGVALGRRVPVFPVNVDMTPYGLLGSYQAIPWKHTATDPPRVLAEALIDLFMANKQIRDRAIEALVQRLVSARSYDEANGAASKLRSVKSELSMDQIKRLVDAEEDNSQVNGAFSASPFIRRLAENLQPTTIDDYGPDEAPF